MNPSRFHILPHAALAALLACALMERASAAVAVSVDWSNVRAPIDPLAYGCNGPFLLDDTKSTNPAYQSIMRTAIGTRDGTSALLRLHGWGMIGSSAVPGNGWLANGAWDAAKIQRSLQPLVDARFNLLINIPSGPAGSSDVADIPKLAQFCADLVRIVNVDNNFGVVYWEVPNEREGIITNAANMASLVSACSRAMKAVDPTIKVGGPALSWSNVSYLTTFVTNALADIDFVTAHTYPGDGTQSNASTYDSAQNLAGTVTSIRNMLNQKSPGRYIPFWMNEYNAAWQNGVNNANHIGAVQLALINATVLSNGGDATAYWVDQGWFPFFNTQTNELYLPGRVLQRMNQYFWGEIVTTSTSNTQSVVPYATSNGSWQSVMLINRTDAAQTANLSFPGWSRTTDWTQYQMSASGYSDATPVTGAAVAAGLTLPANSVTMLVTVSDGANAPTISTLNPADNATGAAVGANLVATFSKTIAKGTGDITIKNLSDGTQTTIAITDAQVTASGTTLTINPTVDLVGDKSYAIQIASTAIKDLADNAFAGITNDTTWNFATAPPDTTAPTPDPMTFASPPSATSQTSITMTATTASDPSGVEYFFECTAGGGNSSGWQDSPVYTDTGLTSGTEYTYRVRARDKNAAQTATDWSATASATTSNVGFKQTDAGPWDYNTTGNWNGGTINGLWDSSLTLTANQTATFAADTSAETGLTFNYAGNFPLLLQSSSATTRNLTLGGNISLNTGGGTTANVTIGSSSNPLNINLGGATRTTTVAANRTLTLANVVSNGGISKTGAGTLTLAGDNSYTGVTTIGTGAGRIIVAHNNALGTTAGNTTILANGTNDLVVNSGITTAENITITGTTEALGYIAAISGGGTLSGTITLGTGSGNIRMGGVTFSGTITQAGSRTLVLNGTTINNAITINGARLSILNGTSILKGVSGSGIGQTALDQGGVLQLGVTNALNTANDLNIGTYGSQDGTFDLASFDQTVRGLTSGSTGTARKVINSVASTTSTLTVGNGNGTYTFSGTILNNNGTGGTVALVKTGTGTQTLSGANTYSGPTTIGNGILILSNALAMQNSALDTTGSIAGTSSVGLRTTITTLTLGGLTGNKNFAATGGVFSTTSGGYGSVTALTLNPGTGASHSYSGVIANGASGMTLTKTGAGTQTLTGNNTYTGATTVNAGTLLINGSTSNSSAVTVNGGDLGGTGTIGGNVTVAAAGNLAPGSTAGTLNITGNLDISAMASGAGTLKFGLNGLAGTNDKITVGGNLALGNLALDDLAITNLGSLEAGTYTLITSTGLTGTVDASTEPIATGFDGRLQTNGNNLELVVTVAASVASFEISTIASPQTVGTPITGITLTAKDAANATATSFTGTVNFGGTGGFTGTSANFVAGVLSGVSITPTVAGSNLTFTVDDGASHSGSVTIATIRTPYEAWAVGGTAFNEDTNNDGVDNGMAWVLGATQPNETAADKLPKATSNGANLRLSFRCLKSNKRGGAVLKVQTSSDMGLSDPWTSHDAAVPDADGTVNSVVFDTTDDGDYVNVIADIPISGPRTFARLKAEMVMP